jgi:pimeloyl-ACP methyl ester carboxylesterase
LHRFVLVHGGTYGSWAWDALRGELRRLGHKAWAPDFPVEDVDAGIDDYLDVLRPAVAAAGPSAVLVGHSMGGRVIAYAALELSVGGLIFLCATLPGTVERDSAEARKNLSRDVEERLRRDRLGRLYYEPDDARYVFFHDCAEAVAESAIRRLRPQATRIIEQTRTLPQVPSVAARYIVCSEDRAVRPDYGRGVARDILGVEPIEFISSHSPFLSRPGDLAQVLVQVAETMSSQTSSQQMP